MLCSLPGLLVFNLWLTVCVTFLLEELAERRGPFQSCSFARLGESLRGDDAFVTIEMPLSATLGASHSISFLPKGVGMAVVLVSVGLIHTLAGEEFLEGRFIDTFVNIDSTFIALEVACCFCEGAFVCIRLVLLLLGQQIFDDLGPGCFLWQGLSLGGWCVADVFNEDLWAIFMKSGFKDAGC